MEGATRPVTIGNNCGEISLLPTETLQPFQTIAYRDVSRVRRSPDAQLASATPEEYVANLPPCSRGAPGAVRCNANNLGIATLLVEPGTLMAKDVHGHAAGWRYG
jgi:hypothetical protein